MRITPEDEDKLLVACELLDDLPKSPLIKVTPEIVEAVRTRASGGEMQKDIAAGLGLSRALICQIVNGRVWNLDIRRRHHGAEMKRRLIGAFDLGVRSGEMLLIQV